MFKPTIDNAIRDMKTSMLFFLTKNNKFYSSVANKYMKDKEKFLPFVIEERREKFIESYAEWFQEVGTVDDKIIAWELLNWEHAGDIMMLLSDNTDWSLVDETLHLQGHTGGTISALVSKVLDFSPYGLDFVEHIWGAEERKKAEKEIASEKKSSTSRRKKSSNSRESN